jgi:hypothetical protein
MPARRSAFLIQPPEAEASNARLANAELDQCPDSGSLRVSVAEIKLFVT